YFRGERAELVHHDVDGVLELEDFAARISGDLARQLATRDSGSDVGDVSHLAGEVRRHEVHVVGEVLPRAGDLRHLRLAAQSSFGSYLTRHARYFLGECAQLIHHGVDGVLQLQCLAARFDGDCLGEISFRHRSRHGGNISYLARQIPGERIHIISKVFPGAADAGYYSLTSELTLGSYFSRHARHFIGEGAELVDHGVHGRADAEEFALHRLAVNFEHHLLAEI